MKNKFANRSVASQIVFARKKERVIIKHRQSTSTTTHITLPRGADAKAKYCRANYAFRRNEG